MPRFFRLLLYSTFKKFFINFKLVKLTAGICVFMIPFFSDPLRAQPGRPDPSMLRMLQLAISDTLKVASRHPEHFLIELNEDAVRTDLASAGMTIMRPLGAKLFVVKARPDLINRYAGRFKEVRPVNYLWKLEDALWQINKNDTHTFTLRCTDPAGLTDSLRSKPQINIISVHDNILRISTSLEMILQNVITLENVNYIGLESVSPREESRVLDLNLGPNTINLIHHNFPQWNGNNMTISVQEHRYDPDDIDLDGRDIPSALGSSEISGHATAMATIAAGAGNSFITGRGVAGAANITSSAFDDLQPDADEAYAELNTWVQNHSYGTVIENFYGAMAEAYDQSANRNPQLLHVFSSGNEGAAASSQGTYHGITGFANLTGNFKMAKNILTVGSVDTVGRPVFFSSRGPAHDGRIKPEMVAYSTEGSSNSAALVSGLVLLLQQAYQDEEGTLPPSALIKSLLLNSAQDVGLPGVDFITGFGNADGFRTLQNLLDKNYFSGSINHGEIKTFDLPIPLDARNLKITLVWNDPAAFANAEVALVNDLDMRMESNGNTWLPWVLDAAPDAATLEQPAFQGTDHLNNVEQITIAEPSQGNYAITIEGFDIPSGPQEFFIAYQWDTLNQFKWTYPAPGDNVPYDGETATYFYWQSTLTETSGRLEYSIDNEQTWITIADAVDLKTGYYRWHDVPKITSRAHARIVAGSQSYKTGRFTISRPLRVTVGFNCEDSVLIQWHPQEGVDQYEIYTFNEKFLETLTTTSDTAMIFRKSEFPSRFYAVQPLLQDGTPVIRSLTFDYDLLGSECYLLSFISEVVPEEGIYLKALLGTTYGVERLIFEHQEGGIFQIIGEVFPTVSNTIPFLHVQPHQGLNRYRVRVQFVNGEEIVSDVLEDYFLTEVPFLVFPNPVLQNEELNIFTKEFRVHDVMLRLYRSDGSQVMETKLTSDREVISLHDLTPGLYLYTIHSEEGRFSGKLVVR